MRNLILILIISAILVLLLSLSLDSHALLAADPATDASIVCNRRHLVSIHGNPQLSAKVPTTYYRNHRFILPRQTGYQGIFINEDGTVSARDNIPIGQH